MEFREFKRRAASICKYSSQWIVDDLYCLKDLGHVEVELDLNGRLAYIHPNPAQLYLLPTMMDGLKQYVLTGCANLQKVNTLIDVCNEEKVAIDITKNSSK